MITDTASNWASREGEHCQNITVTQPHDVVVHIESLTYRLNNEQTVLGHFHKLIHKIIPYNSDTF